MLRALVIHPNQKTKDVGDLLAIARSEAQKKEHTGRKIPVKALKHFPELGVYVVVHESCSKTLA